MNSNRSLRADVQPRHRSRMGISGAATTASRCKLAGAKNNRRQEQSTGVQAFGGTSSMSTGPEQPSAGPETARLSTVVAMAGPTKREGFLSLFILTMETTSLLLACPSFSPSQRERPCSFFLVNEDNYFLHMKELMGNQTRSMKDSEEDFVSCTQWRLLSSSSSRCQWIQASVFHYRC
jgi:hypothetical protein